MFDFFFPAPVNPSNRQLPIWCRQVHVTTFNSGAECYKMVEACDLAFVSDFIKMFFLKEFRFVIRVLCNTLDFLFESKN